MQANRDGFSTGGSLGAGLGTMARQSHLFDIYSVAGAGSNINSLGQPNILHGLAVEQPGEA